MPKEKSFNPVQSHAKQLKKQAIRKQKSTLSAARAEKLSKRNPARLQSQIDELKQKSSGAELRGRDKDQLERLERELGAVKRARERLGVPEKEPRIHHERKHHTEGNGILGKRRRDFQPHARHESDSSDTDEEARNIPMPTDTENMPPLPRRKAHKYQPAPPSADSTTSELPPRPTQTVYSSAPQVRNLHKEAVSRFVPAVVASKIAASQGKGKLLEPEEADALAMSGYSGNRDKYGAKDDAERAAEEEQKELQYRMMADESVEGPAPDLEEEERRFQRELMEVEQDAYAIGTRPAEHPVTADTDQAIRGIVNEMENELEHKLMAEEAVIGPANDTQEESIRFERVARQVEMEEVSDEDL